MSTDVNKDTACPNVSGKSEIKVCAEHTEDSSNVEYKEAKKNRKVSFPSDDQLVTQYFEPENPWQDVPTTSRAQLAAEYLECCRCHNTPPIDALLYQIREIPEAAIGGCTRAPRLTLCECTLYGWAPIDALEALLRRVQFLRIELDHALMDDEGAEAFFDMMEYYESAIALSINGPRQFGIRGWQAACRMIKRSAELRELEVCSSPLEASHAPVLARALRPQAGCRLRVLCLQRTQLAGEPLLCLVIALKFNNSVRELRLGDNRLTPSDAVQLASLLKVNTRIHLLDLSNNMIQDMGTGHIADAVVAQATHTPPSPAVSPVSPLTAMGGLEPYGLEYLVLWNNQLTRNSANHLGKMMRWSKSLCVLNVGRNSVGAECVRALCGSRAASLGLQAARLGPDAAVPLADMLANTHQRLQRLDLRDNRLGAAGLQAILTALNDNKTITQIDLDDPPECSHLVASDAEAATVARLTREIRAACARNEPPAASPDTRARLHRKISLTCHTAAPLPKQSAVDEERKARLRSPAPSPSPSPAPSPAGSPVPHAHAHTQPHHHHNSRFMVQPVTPDREISSGSSSPSTPTRSPSVSSRFKVVQVIEPPQIQVHSATDPPKRTSSRFSVSRNFDSIYNLGTHSPPPTPKLTAAPESPIPEKSEPRIHSPELPKFQVKTSEPVEVKNDSVIVRTEEKTDKSVIKNEQTIKKCVNVGESDTIPANNIDINKDKEIVESGSNNIGRVNSPAIRRDNLSDKELENPIYKDNSEEISHCEDVSAVDEEKLLKTETKIVKTSTEINETESVEVKVEVTVTKEMVQDNDLPAKVHFDQNVGNDNKVSVNIDRNIDICNSENNAMKQIEAITQDLGNLLQEMKDLSTKASNLTKRDVDILDCTQTNVIDVCNKLDTLNDVPVNLIRNNVVLKKNRSESSLDSPDLEVSRLMNKKLVSSPFCDSSSSLEISGSSVESLNALDTQTQICKPIIIQESVESDSELDRRKFDVGLSTESSIESNTSDVTPVNCGNFLNMSVSSNDSMSPIIFTKKIHGSLSSLEASVSSLESTKQEKVMVTSADSGIEYSLQNPSENKDDNSSNEGTLTNKSFLRDSEKKPECLQPQDTLTSSPKRTSSLLDVPALKTKGLDRIRKISLVAPSSSFHIPKPEPESTKLSTNLEKLLSLFQNPSSLFRSTSQNEEEKKSASNTPPRKDSSLTSSFWSWGSSTEKVEKDDKLEDRDSSEATDSTLSERVQVSFVDETFSKKLDSKTPSTDTDNTLSEFQSIQGNSETDVSQGEADKKLVTDLTTDDNLVQKVLDLSLRSIDNASSNGNKPRVCDIIDLAKPNDLNKNYDTPAGDSNKNCGQCDKTVSKESEICELKNIDVKLEDVKPETVRPKTFAAVLKCSGSENSLGKQSSPEIGHPVDKLPHKVIRGIKENISPENTLTSSMTNTEALAIELTEKQVKTQTIVNALWEVTLLNQGDNKLNNIKDQSDLAPIATIEEIAPIATIEQMAPIATVEEMAPNATIEEMAPIATIEEMAPIATIEEMAPIATIEEVCDESINVVKLDFIDDIKDTDEKNISEIEVRFVESSKETKYDCNIGTVVSSKEMENVDLGKDALCYLMYENRDFEPEIENDMLETSALQSSLAQELKDAEIKEQMDLSPELVMEETKQTELFTCKDVLGLKTAAIPERAKIKKSNSLEDISQTIEDKKISNKGKTIAFNLHEKHSTPCDIPERRSKLRTRSGSSPKSLPESLNKPSPLSKMDSIVCKKKKKVSSLGKIARDSLLALNMSEEDIAEFRRSYKLTSVESLRSLESVSEDAFSQSGNSVDSRCRSCLRTSQESLMSLDSITEDCRCNEHTDAGHSAR